MQQQMNGHSSNHNNHNGYAEHNGYAGHSASVMLHQPPKVASIEMCVFCFDTLHAELNQLGSIGYTPRFTNEP